MQAPQGPKAPKWWSQSSERIHQASALKAEFQRFQETHAAQQMRDRETLEVLLNEDGLESGADDDAGDSDFVVDEDDEDDEGAKEGEDGESADKFTPLATARRRGLPPGLCTSGWSMFELVNFVRADPAGDNGRALLAQVVRGFANPYVTGPALLRELVCVHGDCPRGRTLMTLLLQVDMTMVPSFFSTKIIRETIALHGPAIVSEWWLWVLQEHRYANKRLERALRRVPLL